MYDFVHLIVPLPLETMFEWTCDNTQWRSPHSNSTHELLRSMNYRGPYRWMNYAGLLSSKTTEQEALSYSLTDAITTACDAPICFCFGIECSNNNRSDIKITKPLEKMEYGYGIHTWSSFTKHMPNYLVLWRSCQNQITPSPIYWWMKEKKHLWKTGKYCVVL